MLSCSLVQSIAAFAFGLNPIAPKRTASGIGSVADDVAQAIDVLAALLFYVSKNSLKRGVIRMDI